MKGRIVALAERLLLGVGMTFLAIALEWFALRQRRKRTRTIDVS
ncbi:MAG: hypothetical protein WEB00_13875 [Dehalococcoidia bacterium]